MLLSRYELANATARAVAGHPGHRPVTVSEPDPRRRGQPGGRRPAPPPLALVQDFVNTRNVEAGTDVLEHGDVATAWLADAGLIGAGVVLDDADADELRTARETLRELLASHHTGTIPAPVAASMARLARRARPRLAFDDGVLRAVPAGDDIDAAITRLLLAIGEAETLGVLGRLRVCASDACRWAFYDHSPNGRSRWCAPELCGNKAYTRGYRARRSATEERAGRERRRDPDRGTP
jgi:predicted RNA-binding Zn ribbon-like protein